MEKEFTPYTESQALKELGFDEPCFGFYTYKAELRRYINHDGELNDFQTLKNSKITVGDDWCTAPLYQQAFRWFREKHNLEYQIMKSGNGNYYVTIHKNTQEYLDTIAGLSNACLDEVVDCYSYEEAELACLRKLIKIVKNK